MAELTKKQKVFVKEYLIDLNATQAMIRAGYSAKTANEAGSRMLAKVSVKKAIEESLAERSEKLDITAEYVLNGLKTVAERCMQGTPVLEFDKQMGEYVMTGEWKFDSGGANKSLELLGKYMKLFTDKQEIDATIDTTIKVEITDD